MKHTPEQLAAWLQAYQQKGDQKALELLCRSLEEIMRGYFKAKFFDKAVVDDLCQETYIRLLRTLPTIQEPMKLKNFVLKVSFHVMQTHFRKKYSGVEEVSGRDIDGDSTRESFVDHIHSHAPMDNLPQRMDMQQALGELPEKTREILLLKADGYKYEEIAETLGISVSGVKMQVKRGMEKLKNLLISVTFWWFIATYYIEMIKMN